MRVSEIDKMIATLESLERVDKTADYHKSMAIAYLKNSADCLDDKGIKSVPKRQLQRTQIHKTTYIVTQGETMKQPKKLNLANKKLFVAVGLDPAEWMNLLEDTDYLHIIHKSSSDTKSIDKKERVIVGEED